MPPKRMHMRGAHPRVKAPKGTFKRLLKYVFKCYGKSIILVLLCLIISGAAGTVASTFIQSIVDDVITPGLANGFNSVKGELNEIILKMIAIYF